MIEKLTIAPPKLEDMSALTELCMRSKAYWGYNAEFLEACLQELAVRESDFEAAVFLTATKDGELAGIIQLDINGPKADLSRLFVEPSMIGHGIGRILFEVAKQKAIDVGVTAITIDADPDAVAFYERMGAVRYGEVRSTSIPGRFLPHLILDLTKNEAAVAN